MASRKFSDLVIMDPSGHQQYGIDFFRAANLIRLLEQSNSVALLVSNKLGMFLAFPCKSKTN